jgi:hypothetical protein
LTVIVAARTGKNRVTIAADSEVTGAWEKGRVTTPKVWAERGYAFGVAGSLRSAQVLRHHVDWPRWDPSDDFETHIIRYVVPSIRYGIAEHGIAKRKRGSESFPTHLVIAAGPNLAVIEDDYCVVGSHTGRVATGSGYAEALGALGDRGPWTEGDVVEAARRASVTAVGVGGPISIVDTKRLRVLTQVDDLD